MELKNRKHERFCQEYIIDFNGSEAAIRAKYAKNSARITASKLLTNPNIQGRIAELMAERSKRTQITADFVLTNLKEIVRRCMDGKRFNAMGASRALELLGRHLEMFTDKSKIDETIKVTIEDLRERNVDEA